MLIQMSVAGMILEDDEKYFFLLLKEKDGEIIVSTQIDQFQAEFIATFMDSTFRRIPEPYEFLSDIMDSFELRISKVIIKNWSRRTKNAEVFLTDGEREIRVDSRIGDAVATALIVDAPIFIDNDFLGITHKEKLKKWISQVKPSDFGE